VNHKSKVKEKNATNKQLRQVDFHCALPLSSFCLLQIQISGKIASGAQIFNVIGLSPKRKNFFESKGKKFGHMLTKNILKSSLKMKFCHKQMSWVFFS
jgi:hypothetical protein